MLWYLHLCATSDVVVVDYVDEAHGTMETNEDGGGPFRSVVLAPRVTVLDEATRRIRLSRRGAQPSPWGLATGRSSSSPLRSTVTGPSSLTAISVADGSS